MKKDFTKEEKIIMSFYKKRLIHTRKLYLKVSDRYLASNPYELPTSITF